MTHPCADHIATCDRCALCEAGVCCAGLSAAQRVQVETAVQARRFQCVVAAEVERREEQFQQAVAADVERTFSLAELVQIETERQVLGAPLHRAALPIRTLAPSDPHSDSRKEGVYVHAARAVR
jgi:hypothetical protein